MHMTASRVNEDGFLSQNRLQAQVLQPLVVRCSWGVNHELLQDDRTEDQQELPQEDGLVMGND